MNALSDQEILTQVHQLDPPQQQELLDFLAFLLQKQQKSAASSAPDFDQASEYVLKKNAELYKRLA